MSSSGNNTEMCMKKTLVDKASLYLYPCTIQFCIIAAAMLYRLYTNVGLPVKLRLPGCKSTKQRLGGICHKSNSGLFLGLFILVAICISMCFFLIYDKEGKPFQNEITFLVYLGGDGLVTILALFAVFIGFCRIYKLDKGEGKGTVLDLCLLLVSGGGYFLLLIFIIIPTVKSVHFKDKVGILATAQVGLYGLAFVSSFFQIIFIIDGLRRRTTTRHQLKTKPGRSLITFLLICNLAMWVVNTFELKEMHSYLPLRLHYGDLAWQIVLHACFPLTIFFRFYSSVCLSDIWLHAYKRKRQNSQIYKGKHESDRFI